MHQDGETPARIRRLTKSRAVDRTLERYERGKNRAIEEFVGRPLAGAALAELHGAWAARFGEFAGHVAGAL